MENGFSSPPMDQSQVGGAPAMPALDEPRPPTPAGSGSDESANVAGMLSAEQQEKLADACLRDFDSATKGRSGRMKKLKEFTELYAGLLKPKIFPFQRCANINLNILSYTSLQTHARLYDMIWPDNGKVIYSWPSTVDDIERAEITEKFSNSYVRNKMPELAQGLDDSLAQLVVYGSTFRRTYWDTYEGRARSDWIPVEDFVVSHEFRSQDPSMRDVPCYTMVMHPTILDLQMQGAAGVYVNTDKLTAEEPDRQNSEVKDVANKIDGTSTTSDSTDDDKPRMVLEQHRKWKLPNKPELHPAFDGKAHYVAATIDKQSRKLLRLIVREEDDPEDAKRFAKEDQPYQDFLIKQAAYEQAAANPMMVMGPDGIPQPGPPPFPPTPVPEPAPTRKRQVCFFTHYKAFPSEGFYGLGFGDFIGPVNRAANTLLNQHIDGVTMRNARPGFISRQMRMQRGSIQVQPGMLVEVDAPPSAIREGIVWLDPPLNDPTTMPLVNLLISICDKFAGSSDIMSGATSGANRTAKEVQILNAQLMKQISILAKRVREALRHEFDKLWRLWGTFLPDEPEPTDIIDPTTGGPQRIPVSRKMFIPDARVFPAADPRMRFEKVDEAMQKFSIVTQNPMLMQNPMVLRAVTEDVLKAHDAERLIAFLPKPQEPPPPPQPKPHYEEEANWLREQDNPPHPMDNDPEHIQGHLMFLQSPRAQTMTKTGRDMADRHIRFHEAQDYQKKIQAAQQQQQQQMGGPPGGAP